MPGQEKEEGAMVSTKDDMSIFYILVNIYVMALLPFLRRGMGKRAIGKHGVFAMVLILLYASRMRSPEMVQYFYASLAMVFWRRVTADRTQLTVYQGWPILTGRRVKDEMLARCGECVLVFIIGRCLFAWSPAVGQFVTCGSLALFIKYVIDALYIARQKEAYDDAIVEMENRTERLRQRR
jgi:hypothetical protein